MIRQTGIDRLYVLMRLYKRERDSPDMRQVALISPLVRMISSCKYSISDLATAALRNSLSVFADVEAPFVFSDINFDGKYFLTAALAA